MCKNLVFTTMALINVAVFASSAKEGEMPQTPNEGRLPAEVTLQSQEKASKKCLLLVSVKNTTNKEFSLSGWSQSQKAKTQSNSTICAIATIDWLDEKGKTILQDHVILSTNLTIQAKSNISVGFLSNIPNQNGVFRVKITQPPLYEGDSDERSACFVTMEKLIQIENGEVKVPKENAPPANPDPKDK